MTKEELKAQHPELYAAVLEEGRVSGEATGQAKERKRCVAHVKMGKSTGAVEFAHKAIESGVSTLDEDVHAEYLSAGINRNHQATRQSEGEAARAVVEGATPPAAAGGGEGGRDLGDEVADLVAVKLGHKPKIAAAPAAAS